MAKRSSKENARRAQQAKQPATRAAAEARSVTERREAAKGGGAIKTSAAVKASGAVKRSAAAKQPAPAASQWGATAAVPTSPLSLMRRFAEGMDRLFTDFHLDASPRLDFPFRAAGAPGSAAWAPRVDVIEQGGRFVIRADLPGLTRNDVKVEVSDDAVAIRGERRQERETKGKGFYHSERSYGSFYRAIPLPEGVAADQATATFRNGVLEVSMPAPPRAAKGRPVAIEE